MMVQAAMRGNKSSNRASKPQRQLTRKSYGFSQISSVSKKTIIRKQSNESNYDYNAAIKKFKERTEIHNQKMLPTQDL